MKESYYFSHDSNARRDPKILQLRSDYGLEGYGLYWMIIETLREQDGYKLKHSFVNVLTLDFNVTKEFISQFIKTCLDIELLASDEEYFWSDSLCNRMQYFEEKRQKLRQAGKLGANTRWQKNGDAIKKDGDAKVFDSSKVKESKLKEVVENEISPEEKNETTTTLNQIKNETEKWGVTTFDKFLKDFPEEAILKAYELTLFKAPKVPGTYFCKALLQGWKAPSVVTNPIKQEAEPVRGQGDYAYKKSIEETKKISELEPQLTKQQRDELMAKAGVQL